MPALDMEQTARIIIVAVALRDAWEDEDDPEVDERIGDLVDELVQIVNRAEL